MQCTSCKKNIVGKHSTNFKCPKCQQTIIVRCGQCRKNAVNYKCEKCGFEGP